jgi:leucyl-tRNA synthetase
MSYPFDEIEQRWQQYWADHRTFSAANPGQADFDRQKPKFYVLDMFPYPSGVGLHVGHPLGYIATDIFARYKRMNGFNVLHPMGYDAFGLPAEQFAVEHGVHPRVTTEQNIANMTRQLKRLGLSYDWGRTVSTTDPGYYRWTQWIFLRLFHSWFDPAAKAARPIDELRKMLESGEYMVDVEGQLAPVAISGGMDVLGGPPVGARKWYELSEPEQAEVIDNHRLAYMADVPVNWCPALGTVLANEEVTNDGRSERGNHPVYRRPLRQWMLRITAYAERLLDDLDLVDWPEPIKLMQRNWIGKSQGAWVDFALVEGANIEVGESVRVFTTRPDTLFGATYMVLAPEHPMVEAITTAEQYHAVSEYRTQAASKADADRQADTRTKTGVFTGAYAVNPLTGKEIPIWIADYVLMGYGTGAIMAVPGHDERDFQFARQFSLPIVPVVMPTDHWLTEHGRSAGAPAGDADALRSAYLADPTAFGTAYVGDGVNVNSDNPDVSLNGLVTAEAKARIIGWLQAIGAGRGAVQYKLRDWLFSRQRYWGEPFPILHGPGGEIRPIPEAQLPVLLPEMEDFRPTPSDDPAAAPQPPLGRAPEEWKYVTIDGVRYQRELNTMPQWAGSCWYYLRFCDPDNNDRFVGREAERYWMHGGSGQSASSGGVDLYVGGAEHAVLHLLYARFWHKVLFDLGHVSTPEPFGRLFNQGYIQAAAYTDERGIYVPAEEVEQRDGKHYHAGREVRAEFGKMGKSLKNAIAPDDVCEQYGCDTLRLYEMYLGPLDASKQWNTRDIIGVHRFLQRLWRNFVEEDTGRVKVSDDPAPTDLLRLVHRTIRRVTDDMERLSFNTAIAALIELNNELVGRDGLPREVAEPLVLLLSPLAPHMAEELWSRLGYDTSLAYEPWPISDASLLTEAMIEYPVQVNGKLRGRISAPPAAGEQQVSDLALADPRIVQAIAGQTVRKVIVVHGKLVNIVVG